MSEFRKWRRRRDALLESPTLAGALEFWDYKTLGKPERPDVPLAGIHKARLHWPKATPEQVAESRKWLADHGYSEFNPLLDVAH
jgi:hypothetical protein